MGATASKIKTIANSQDIILSLDALGTLYRFRSPVAQQYLTVAQRYGLNSSVELPQLEASFKAAFKATSAQYPNYGIGYGGGHKKLPNPEAWWSEVVTRTFKPLVTEELDPELSRALYQHFSSSAAYELYPDVLPFLERMKEIRQNTEGPMFIIGIITNSDPRVKDILESLNLKIAMPKFSTEVRSFEDTFRRTGEDLNNPDVPMSQWKAPWEGDLSTDKSFDFLATSYDAKSEKPDTGIIHYAASMVNLVRLIHFFERMTGFGPGFEAIMKSVAKDQRVVETSNWIHVGDDYNKDIAPAKAKNAMYEGQKVPNRKAIHLVRAGEGKRVRGTDTVSSLTEVTAIINLMLKDQSIRSGL